MPEREVKAGEFKAKCLQLMDEVAETGDSIVVTKHGKAVARLVPVAATPPRQGLFGLFKGQIRLANPNDDYTVWDQDMQRDMEEDFQDIEARIDAPKRQPQG